ncbi:hypothetical protein [Mesorhizobium sp. M0909]|uniref:hypothetical protein n=1 Tax=Mesorhizobium sp. M0909 TaxID=2957024 RepID=UPI003335B89A
MNYLRVFLLPLLLCTFPGPTLSADYGYIRVDIANHVEHDAKVQLFANGHPLGIPFDHATRDYPWQAVRLENLNARANSTRVTTKYSFQGSNCEFDYFVEFTFDKALAPVRWGPYHAPRNTDAGQIPIGTLCEGGMKVCSSNPALNEKLVAAYKSGLVAQFNRNKAEYDQRLRERAEQAREQELRMASSLRDQPPADFSRSDLILGEFLAEYQEEFDRIREQARNESQSALETTPDAEALVAQASEQARAEAREKAVADLQRTTTGEIVVGIVQLDRSLAELVRQREREQRMFEEEGMALPGDAEELESQKQAVEFFRREILRGETFMKITTGLAERGIKKIPYLGTGITACEIATGRTMCLGQPLSVFERLEKACKYAAGKGLKWANASRFLFGDPANSTDRLFAKQFETYVKTGACSGLHEDKPPDPLP